ncbi:MAG: dihydromethanopterin reductase (acceptor) [Candidatus Bathyarchaeota archaeon]
MVLHVAWAITGAGHLLEETFNEIYQLTMNNKIKVTTILSPAGEQVVRMYGLWNKLKLISPGGYLQEILIEKRKDPGFSNSGRFIFGLYKLLIVSPASGNTVAKIVYGIADTYATNAVAQAQKANIPVYVVPTDQKEGAVTTTLPNRIERKECKLCVPCPLIDACSYSAIKVSNGIPRIDSRLCQGCGVCTTSCKFGAVKIKEKKKLYMRKIDIENFTKLHSMEKLTVLEHPKLIETIIEKF